MTEAEYKSHFELTKDTFRGKLWDVCCENFGENSLHHNSIMLQTSIITLDVCMDI